MVIWDKKNCTIIVGPALKIIVLHLHGYRKVAALSQWSSCKIAWILSSHHIWQLHRDHTMTYVRLANCNGSAFNFFDLIAFPPSVLGVISIKNDKLYTFGTQMLKTTRLWYSHCTITARKPHRCLTISVWDWGDCIMTTRFYTISTQSAFCFAIKSTKKCTMADRM